MSDCIPRGELSAPHRQRETACGDVGWAELPAAPLSVRPQQPRFYREEPGAIHTAHAAGCPPQGHGAARTGSARGSPPRAATAPGRQRWERRAAELPEEGPSMGGCPAGSPRGCCGAATSWAPFSSEAEPLRLTSSCRKPVCGGPSVEEEAQHRAEQQQQEAAARGGPVPPGAVSEQPRAVPALGTCCGGAGKLLTLRRARGAGPDRRFRGAPRGSAPSGVTRRC